MKWWRFSADRATVKVADFDPAVESFPRIVNRHGLAVFVKLLMVPGSKRCAYLAHGLGNSHDSAALRALTQAFVSAGYNVIVWDATHSPNRSDGETAKASFYNHHQDLEDVIDWSKTQGWYQPSFMVAGHSLGAMAAGTYAAAHAQQVSGLVLVAPVVSGATLRRRVPLPMRAWWRVRGRVSPKLLGMNPYSWELMRSGWSYDLLAVAHRLTMPVMVMGASRDVLIPPRLLRRLTRAIKSEHTRLEIVPGARHGFDQEWEMSRLTAGVGRWLDEVGGAK